MAVPAKPAGGAPIESAWGSIVHDEIVAMEIQSGVVNCVHTNSQLSAVVPVTFPHAFAAPPVLVLGCDNYNYGAGLSGAVPTAAGFNVATWRYSGVQSAATVPVQWIAYGPRA
jgi:hypothetical protein